MVKSPIERRGFTTRKVPFKPLFLEHRVNLGGDLTAQSNCLRMAVSPKRSLHMAATNHRS